MTAVGTQPTEARQPRRIEPENRGKRGVVARSAAGKALSARSEGTDSLLGKVPLSAFESDQHGLWSLDQAAALALIPQGVIVASASLTTAEQTHEALDSAWVSARKHALGAILLDETGESSEHLHAHGLMLFVSDQDALAFKHAFSTAAGGVPASCVLKELGGSAAFHRVEKKARPTWEDGRGFEEQVVSVLRYASKKRGGLFVAHGPFASLGETRSEARQCACGCGRSLAGRRPHCDAFNGACRRRIQRKKVAALPCDSVAKRGTCIRCFAEPCDCAAPGFGAALMARTAAEKARSMSTSAAPGKEALASGRASGMTPGAADFDTERLALGGACE